MELHGPSEWQTDFLLIIFRPLLTTDEACWLLGEPSQKTMVRMLESGDVRGVDISAAGEQTGRLTLRVYRYSVERLLLPERLQRHQPLVQPLDLMLPHSRPTLRKDEVAQLLNCTPKHVGNLPLEGPRLRASSSAGSADRIPRIHRASLLQFLTSREIQP